MTVEQTPWNTPSLAGRQVPEAKRRTAAYGESTRAFLEYLRVYGPQTRGQLEGLPFWGGVRTRVRQLERQGRVKLVKVANPITGPHEWAAVTAFKYVDGAPVDPVRKPSLIRRERERKRIERAIALLEQSGYEVRPVAVPHGA